MLYQGNYLFIGQFLVVHDYLLYLFFENQNIPASYDTLTFACIHADISQDVHLKALIGRRVLTVHQSSFLDIYVASVWQITKYGFIVMYKLNVNILGGRKHGLIH